MRQLLSDSFLRKLKVKSDAKRVSLSDTKTKGLAVDVRKNGITFYFRLTHQGRVKRVTLGHFPTLSVAEARAMCGDVMRQALLKSHETYVETEATMCLDEYYQRHFLPWCQVYQKTYSSHRSLYKNHLKDRLGDMHVKDISNKHIYSLVMDLHKNNYSKSFINKSVQHFRSALKKSEQLCEIETHSSLKNTVSLPRAAPKKERFLSDREARRLRDFVHMNGEDEVVLLIGFLMYTGARRHEAMNSEWQHINLGDKDWYVPITKSGKPRHIVLNGKAIEIIQRAEKLQLKKHGHIMQWLFVNPQTHKPYRCIFHKWNRIRNELDLQNMRIHDLRHSFASTLVNNGATLYEVQKLLGHSRSATTERYAHLANHRLQRAASLIDKAYS